MADVEINEAIWPRADMIRSRPVRDCYLCGAEGRLLYAGLRDRFFSAPGEWTMVQCPRSNCGLAWLSPMPLESDIGIAYIEYHTHQHPGRMETPALPPHQNFIGRWLGVLSRWKKAGYLANTYGYGRESAPPLQKGLGWLMYLQPIKRVKVDSEMTYLERRDGGLLLEVGCGNGDLLRRMQGFGWSVEGVDPDPGAVAAASSKGLRVSCGRVEDLRYPADRFDAVVMNHVIEHVENPSGLLRGCRRILKPNGQLIVTTPNKASLCHALYREAWMQIDSPRHMYLFTPRTLEDLVRRVELKPIRLFTSIRDADRVFLASRDIARFGRHAWGTQYAPALRAWGRALQLVEATIFSWSLRLGEDIVFVGTK